MRGCDGNELICGVTVSPFARDPRRYEVLG
jgi:hypothetical protein